jgi:hypothetical protein
VALDWRDRVSSQASSTDLSAGCARTRAPEVNNLDTSSRHSASERFVFENIPCGEFRAIALLMGSRAPPGPRVSARCVRFLSSLPCPAARLLPLARTPPVNRASLTTLCLPRWNEPRFHVHARDPTPTSRSRDQTTLRPLLAISCLLLVGCGSNRFGPVDEGPTGGRCHGQVVTRTYATNVGAMPVELTLEAGQRRHYGRCPHSG